MLERLVLVLVGAVLLSSCRLQLGVDIQVEEDGSGQVEVAAGLDPDAMARVGGELDALLSTADLVAAGWTIEAPDLADDGVTWVRVHRPFADADQAAALFEDLAGSEGPFQDLRIERRSSFARTEWDFTGRLDFAGGLEAFGDAALAAELDGAPLGQTVEEIEATLGEPLSKAVQVQVSIRLPGEVTSNAPGAGDRTVWQTGFGERTVALEATGVEQRTGSMVAAGVAVACAALLALSLLVQGVRFVGRRRAS